MSTLDDWKNSYLLLPSRDRMSDELKVAEVVEETGLPVKVGCPNKNIPYNVLLYIIFIAHKKKKL